MAQTKDKGTNKRTNTKTKKKETQPTEPNVYFSSGKNRRIAIAVLVALAAIFTAITGAMFNLNHKLIGIWTLFTSLALISTSICLNVFKTVRPQILGIFLLPFFLICLYLDFHQRTAPIATPQKSELSNANANLVPTPTPQLPRKLEDGRIVVDMQPEDLEKFFDENTDIQARKLLEPYLDKWIFTWGKVGDVANRKDGNAFIVLGRTDIGNQYTPTLLLFTDKKEIERIQPLKRDDEIKVLGQIKMSETRPAVHLSNCEIVD